MRLRMPDGRRRTLTIRRLPDFSHFRTGIVSWGAGVASWNRLATPYPRFLRKLSPVQFETKFLKTSRATRPATIDLRQ